MLDTRRRNEVTHLNKKNKQRTNINTDTLHENERQSTRVGKYVLIDLSLVKCVPLRIWQIQTQTLGKNT